MKSFSKLLACAAMMASFGVSNAQADPSDIITPFSTLVDSCVDIDPVGDGFGWDGMCTCKIDAPYHDFGKAMDILGDTLLIAASEAPRTCAGAGSATVYQLEDNKAPTKVQELIARARDVANVASSSVAVGRDLFAVTSTDGITIFKQNNGVWEEDRVLPSINDFSNRDIPIFVGDHLVMSGNGDQIVVYSTIDWSITQRIIKSSKQVNTLIPHSDGFVAGYYDQSGSPSYYLEIYSLQNGAFSSGQVFSAEHRLNYDIEGDVLVIGKAGPLNINRIQNNITYRRDASGLWTEIAAPLISNGVSAVRVIDNQLILEQDNSLLIHRLDSVNGWTLQQTYPIASTLIYAGIELHQKSSNRLLITHANFETDDRRNAITIIERGAGGIWHELVSYVHPETSDIILATLLLEDQAFVGTRKAGVLLFNLDTAARESITATEPTSGNINQDCDYTDASDYDGWGFNSVTMTSCPPLNGGVPVNAMTDVGSNVEGTHTTEGSTEEQSNLSPADNETIDAVSTQRGSTSTDVASPGESSASQSGGGGGMWIPLLIFALALRRYSTHL